MKITFDQSFKKDLEKLPEEKYFINTLNCINMVENSKTLSEIPDCKKIQGSKNHYRIKMGNFRIGFEFESPDVVRFVRILHRKEIYRYFPKK